MQEVYLRYETCEIPINIFTKNFFFALDKCYFIKNEPHKIIGEINSPNEPHKIIAINFENTKTQRQIVLSKEKIYQMMNESYQEGNTRYMGFSL
jgi:hypothetical protein